MKVPGKNSEIFLLSYRFVILVKLLYIFKKMKLPVFVLITLCFCFICSCADGIGKRKNGIDTNEKATENDTIGWKIILTDDLLTDGFDFPVGNVDGQGSYKCVSNGKIFNGWYIAAGTGIRYSLGWHTGEDWNGNGGGNTDLGQPVYSIAKGKVIEAHDYGAPWGKVVYIEHHYMENTRLKTCYSLYAHLDTTYVKTGDIVNRRLKIGTLGDADGRYEAHLHFEIRKGEMSGYESTYWPSSHDKDSSWVMEHYELPTDFLMVHRKTTVPDKEKFYVVTVKNEYRMYLYQYGQLKQTWEIALSQVPEGPKQQTGDRRMPEGEYLIIEKKTGPFYGEYAAFLGPAQLKISYPNRWDAEKGYKKGLISMHEKDLITSAHKNGIKPPSNTSLGGDIVIHGWNGEWYNKGDRNLTWGCISMHNSDLMAFYRMIPLKTRILILP